MKRTAAKVCVDCGGSKGDRHWMTQRCTPCRKNFEAQMFAASRAVSKAVRHGVLPDRRIFSCMDCGDRATDYDHRDYSQPLMVDPVCRACNFKRGPAKYSPLPCVHKVAA
jgi:hypothetical protein